MKYLISVICIISIIICGCSSNTSDSSTTDLINLSTPLEEYFLTMSSVPGFPLEFTAEEQSNDNLVFEIALQSGKLIKWNSPDGKITDLGSEVTLSYEDTTVYWSPDFNSIDEQVKMIVNVKDSSTDEVLDSGTYYFVENNGGYKLQDSVSTGY